MGIKHFFHWFKKRFGEDIYHLGKGQVLQELIDEEMIETEIDNLMIDMNGLFHTSAQKIYEYGEFKPMRRLLGERRSRYKSHYAQRIACFEDICKSVEEIVNIVKPKKRIIMCVDGPAPLSKQNQQRQRRYVSAMSRDKDSKSFDSNSITPGTEFMNYLTKYVDWYIRKRISENNSLWSNVEVIFSNEKVPGEGEHKIINYIRRYGSKEEVYCLHGMDADLIMLALGTHLKNFYILREEQLDPSFDYYFIDIGGVRTSLADKLIWNPTSNKSNRAYCIDSAINDFIFMCFTVGNDFLPHIPGIEIIEDGINMMIDVYCNVCKDYGHLTKTTKYGVQFRKKSVKVFMGTLAQYEKGVLEDKLSHKDQLFPVPLLESNSSLKEDGKYELDIEGYREDYYSENLERVDMEKLCHEYLEGMQWVLSYYTSGVPNWRWRFPYHYAPFAHTLTKYIDSFKFSVYAPTTPTVPFVQLLSVLPPKSSNLLPEPLNNLLKSEGSPISQFCPEEFGIDLSGKRREWEGTVLLPMIDYNIVEKAYYDRIRQIAESSMRRNKSGKSFIYTFTPQSRPFKSSYGDFDARVYTRAIDL